MDKIEYWALLELQKDAHLRLDVAMKRFSLLQENIVIEIKNRIFKTNEMTIEPIVAIPPGVARLRNYLLN